MIILEIIEGNSQGQRLELSAPVTTIGRAENNTIALSDFHLSGHHGQIFLEGDQYVYRDLRSTNGSALERHGNRIVVNATTEWEIALHHGDRLLLGDASQSVVILVQIPCDEADDEIGERLIASRSLVDLPAVTHRVEHDPASAQRLFKALKPLSSRLELRDTVNAVVDATFELVPRATHVSVLLRSETDKDRFTMALSKQRDESGRPQTQGELDHEPGSSETVRASRAVLRRVLKEQAAVLTANAQEEIASSESILGGCILSMMAVPLWRGDEIRGLIQADNRSSAGMFNPTDLELAMVLSSQATLALENAALVSRLKVAEERLRGENSYLKRKEGKVSFEDIIGDSQPMKSVLRQLKKVLDTRATVCIEGETGTGKELIASAIHYQSKRGDQMFVAQNCAAMPETLLESELFGHRKGAFTSADADKKGLFEIAHHGTLFLDEVGETSLSLQAKLLRVLQEGTIRPVGSTQEHSVDVRIICATNRDLQAEVEKGNFREDLYYRLMVFPVRLPPLRERREDIPKLTEHFFARYKQEYGQPVLGLAQETLDALSAYNWPGNIRELENEVQRLVIQAEPNTWIEASALSPKLRKIESTLARIAPKKGTLKEMMQQVERWLLSEALREQGGNKTKTAQALGITREGLHKKLNKVGLG